MGTGHADRLWMIGGAVAAVVLIAVGWFFLISPQHARTAGFTGQTDDARTKLVTLQQRLTQLQPQNQDLPEYQAKLRSDQAALPKAADLADFLRSLQTGDTARGVLTGMTVGGPIERAAAGAKVYALPVTLTVEGTTTQLDAMLDYLQQVQPRAVLITNVQFEGKKTAFLDDPSKVTVTLQVFVTSPPGATGPGPTSATAPVPAKTN